MAHFLVLRSLLEVKFYCHLLYTKSLSSSSRILFCDGGDHFLYFIVNQIKIVLLRTFWAFLFKQILLITCVKATSTDSNWNNCLWSIRYSSSLANVFTHNHLQDVINSYCPPPTLVAARILFSERWKSWSLWPRKNSSCCLIAWRAQRMNFKGPIVAKGILSWIIRKVTSLFKFMHKLRGSLKRTLST